jgi:prepilin-type N-terminal cleavage/methylation domain-containing protein
MIFAKHISKNRREAGGFTLIETMIALTLLSLSIVAPMTLTAQSLGAAYYARDEITAFYLAQEGLEAVRSVRDNNILQDAQGGVLVNLLQGIPTIGSGTFTIDTRNNSMNSCGGTCPALTTDGTLYGYGMPTATQFVRTMNACYVQTDGSCSGSPTDEVKVTAAVSWRTAGIKSRTVTLSENLYKWVADGSAGP